MSTRPGPVAALLAAFTLLAGCFDKPDGYVPDQTAGGAFGIGADAGGASGGTGSSDGGAGACEAFANAMTSCIDEAGIESDTGFGDPCAGYLPEYDGYYQCITSAYSPGLCSTDSGFLAFADALETCAEAAGLSR